MTNDGDDWIISWESAEDDGGENNDEVRGEDNPEDENQYKSDEEEGV